jgi:hypothetical protein
MAGCVSRRIAALALLLVCAATPASAAPPARRALLIGIEDYSASGLRGTPPPVRRNWLNLHGAVDDAEAMRAMLVEEYEFLPRDIVLLTNQQATRAAILGAIASHLTQASRAGDIVVFYFAGHGSRVPNSLSTEYDKRDESIVPADSRVGAPDIRDKELRRLFNGVLDRGAKLTVILDSCNSASGTRGLLTGARVRGVRPDPRDVADGTPEGVAPEDRGALVIAAAQDYEMARETLVEGTTDRGVFSWALLRAIARAEDDEPAMETFLRAQAILRGEAADQHPVISGTDEARLTPLFGTRVRRKARDVFIVESVRDRRIVLQGGWTHGLTVGSELVARGDRSVRLEVTAMTGLAQSEARLVSPRKTIEPGTVFELAVWAAPPTRPLRVWMPTTANHEARVQWARDLARLAPRKNIRWITDPTEETPTHLLRVREATWELLTWKGNVERLGARTPAAALARIPSRAALFVQLPVPASMIGTIDVGPGTDREAIVPTARPEHADFILTGRLANDTVSYAWVRPHGAGTESSALPQRTAWQPSNGALALRYAVIRLRRIQAWHLLESPPAAAFTYGLSLRRDRDRAPVRDRFLTAGEAYSLVMRARLSRPPEQRFVYAFMIDGDGKGVLLFPLHGSVENRFPVRRGNTPPAEIVLDGSFDVTEPYGLDTYFLLSTDEPLADPWILEWDGVRGSPAATTPLEELLIRTAGARAPAQPVRIPSRWSIERLLLESVRAPRAKESP